MSLRTSRWPAGVPCWADVTVPDVGAAVAFYSRVLGWSFRRPEAEYGGYVLAETAGGAAAGIGPQQPGTVPAWTLYLASDDADGTAKAITDAGGSVLVAPGDVGPLGRMLIASDPTGATFGVWQAGTHIGAGVVNQPGGLTWEDLRSPDPQRAQAFYAAVFGYRLEPLPMAGADYRLFHLPAEDAPLGGMGGMFGATDRPAHWLVYFGVADTTAAADAAEDAGGAVVAPVFESPYGRMAGLTDPAGALFWVVQTDGSNQPDRSG